MTYQFSYAHEQANNQRERAEVRRQVTPLSEIKIEPDYQRQVQKNIALLILKALAKGEPCSND